MSDKHRTAQAVLYTRINNIVGWQAHLEKAGPNYRSDVIAINLFNGARYSFEIQLASISREAAFIRTLEQCRDGIRDVIWLCDKKQPWTNELKTAVLDYGEGWKPSSDIHVQYPTLPDENTTDLDDHMCRTLELCEFIERFLTSKLILHMPEFVGIAYGNELVWRTCRRWLFIAPQDLDQPDMLLEHIDAPAAPLIC
jgi:hypothetical protein